ncbi:1-phosphofructokinase [Streptomyces sp. NPDC005438]|uniref:1-phosphofructokinase n=1 Tax=Streptomyces sp. NPDC005438 TaxID=3156880 RepID=UPI0033B29915
MTFLTVTPNPSLDRSYAIPHLGRGEVLRSMTDRIDPGGKGVNVSRAVAAHGARTLAVLPLGGLEGTRLARLLEERRIAVAGVPVQGPTRVNLALTESDGTVTKINSMGPELSLGEARALQDAVMGHARGVSWIACCGSLPRGLAPDWYAELVARARAAKVRIALDTSGPPLRLALAERPDVVKPNVGELSEAVGRPLHTVGEVVEAAREMREWGAASVLVTLGPDGQLLVDRTGEYFGHAPVDAVVSNVGAGDASLAGFVLSGGLGQDALAGALAHGAAAVRLPGSAMPAPSDLFRDAVTVTSEVPVDHSLSQLVRGAVT